MSNEEEPIAFKCPHCGWTYTLDEAMQRDKQRAELTLVPCHDYPTYCRSVCPGTGQNPRAPEDRRIPWKDEPPRAPFGHEYIGDEDE